MASKKAKQKRSNGQLYSLLILIALVSLTFMTVQSIVRGEPEDVQPAPAFTKHDDHDHNED